MSFPLIKLPPDLFRVIFQYLSVGDLMKGEAAFLNNRELLSHYRSSLQGFTLKEVIEIEEDKSEFLIPWIIDHRLLVETLKVNYLRDTEMNLWDHIRLSLKAISFVDLSSDSGILQLGHFPLLTSASFRNLTSVTSGPLLSFFSLHPALQIVEIRGMSHLSNAIIRHLSDYCQNIKILTLAKNYWVNDLTLSLLTERFINLKFLDISDTSIRNVDSLRQFILSRPRLSGLSLPNSMRDSIDFLLFYLIQVIFPTILSHSDLESHFFAISSLCDCFDTGLFDKKNEIVNPEIFSVDILSHLHHPNSSVNTLQKTIEVFYHLSKFSFMIDSILQSQFIPILLNDMRSLDCLAYSQSLDLVFRCCYFQDIFSLLLEKYRTQPSSLIQIYRRAIEDHFTILATEELQTMIPVVLNELWNEVSTFYCLKIISRLLRELSSQLLIDPTYLLLSFKSIAALPKYTDPILIECLRLFLSVNESNHHQLFIESNLIPHVIKLVTTSNFIDFLSYCLLSSRDGVLVDHLVDLGLFQKILTNYFSHEKCRIDSLFKLFLEFNNNKYSEILKEMELPNELRWKLFEKREESEEEVKEVKEEKEEEENKAEEE